ncbi:MAG TPA: major capsid protein [Polyangia bacterium]|nr:major capsid protein [Polyangia bacterium]
MPTSNPTANDIHVDRRLTNFGQKWMQSSGAFVSLVAMPNAPVEKQTDVYTEWSRADFNRDEAKLRADGTESQGGGFRVGTSPYSALVYAFHKDLTTRQKRNADEQIRLEMSSVQFVSQKMMLRRERLFQEAFFPAAAASGIWATEFVGDAAPTGNEFLFWDNASSDPVSDVCSASDTIHLATGMRPNRMLMGRQTWTALKNNDSILARISGGATTALPATVMRNLVASLFELESIHVMDSVINAGVATANADINDNESNAFVGGDNALLYFAPQGVSLDMPTAGQQFSWTGFTGATPSGSRITRIPSPLTQSERIEGEMAVDYKVTSPELGFYFHNTVT